MSDGISGAGWLVILCGLAFGFGAVKFMLVQMDDAKEDEARRRADAEDRARHAGERAGRAPD